MIEHQVVDGRPATVSYMNNRFDIVDKDKATLVKVSFDAGGVLFLVPKKESAINAS